MSESMTGAQSARLLNDVYNIGKPGGTTADPVTQRRGQELRLQMMSNRPKPATVLNTHPWPLKLDDPYIRVEIPACPAGQPYVKHVLRSWLLNYGDTQEDGSMIPHPILPYEQARQFYRQAGIMGWGGVIVYEGEASPESLFEKDVAVADLTEEGDPIFTKEQVDGEWIDAPKSIGFKEFHDRSIAKRDHYYLAQVQAAQSIWDKSDGSGRREVSRGNFNLMADVLFREGKMAKKAEFINETREQAGLSEMTCPICGARPKAGAVKCVANCEYIFDPLKAYEHGIIQFEHVSMDRLTAEEWEQAHAIKAKRESARKKASKATKEQ